jgi:Zn finger protein HypA/HybF involved in hydrogenase expression
MTPDRLKEIITYLAQPGSRIMYLETGGGAICGPEQPLTSTELHQLAARGWLHGMPSNRGAWLSEEGRAAYLQSTDEMGSGELPLDCLPAAAPATAAAQPAVPAPVQIAVLVAGGCVDEVYCSAPFEYVVVDRDVLESEEEDADAKAAELLASCGFDPDGKPLSQTDPAAEVWACPTCHSSNVQVRSWAQCNDTHVAPRRTKYRCRTCKTENRKGKQARLLRIPRRETREWQDQVDRAELADDRYYETH